MRGVSSSAPCQGADLQIPRHSTYLPYDLLSPRESAPGLILQGQSPQVHLFLRSPLLLSSNGILFIAWIPFGVSETDLEFAPYSGRAVSEHRRGVVSSAG